jgi:hypothetical protein
MHAVCIASEERDTGPALHGMCVFRKAQNKEAREHATYNLSVPVARQSRPLSTDQINIETRKMCPYGVRAGKHAGSHVSFAHYLFRPKHPLAHHE